MSVMTCPNEKQIRALTLGQLPESESDFLFDHIQNCEDCKKQLDTCGDAHDSLVENIRAEDALKSFTSETNCDHAIAKAIGALAHGTEPPVSIPIPTIIGEYEILHPIGQGGMGNVYLANHTKLGRKVAIKLLAAHRLTDAQMQSRFEQEMQAIGRLSHPNIVTAHDAREVNGTAVLVTEYIDGLDVAKILQSTGKMRVKEACEIGRFVAAALAYTSQQGFVHRDVKPSNIMVSTDGQVKLLDLGLARFLTPGGTEITATGQAMGTADYLAPEQVTDSKSVDSRADIYALGCTLFKLLTGKAPFAEQHHDSAFAKMSAHVHQSPPEFATVLPEAPKPLARLIDSMLAKAPEDRPSSAQEVATVLSKFSSGADLKSLISAADTSTAPVTNHSSSDLRAPQTQTSSRRLVPVMLASVGAGLIGLFLGFILGVLIVIKYPDGTIAKLFAPDGAQVSVTSVPGSSTNNEELGNPNQTSADLPPGRLDGPIAFAVEAQPSTQELKLARDALARAEQGTTVDTPWGRWVAVSDTVNAVVGPDSAFGMIGSQAYVLLSNHSEGAISYEESKKKLAANLTWDPQQKSKVADIFFLGDLENRIQELTEKNIGNKLAIVVDGRVISFVTIATAIGSPARLYGAAEDVEDFVAGIATDEQNQQRTGWLNGVWKADFKTEPGNTDQPLYVVCWKNQFFSLQEGTLLAIGEYTAHSSGVRFKPTGGSLALNEMQLDATARQTGKDSAVLLVTGQVDSAPSSIELERVLKEIPKPLEEELANGHFDAFAADLFALPEIAAKPSPTKFDATLSDAQLMLKDTLLPLLIRRQVLLDSVGQGHPSTTKIENEIDIVRAQIASLGPPKNQYPADQFVNQLRRELLFPLQLKEKTLVDSVGEGHPAVSNIRNEIDVVQKQIDLLNGISNQEKSQSNKESTLDSQALKLQGVWLVQRVVGAANPASHDFFPLLNTRGGGSQASQTGKWLIFEDDSFWMINESGICMQGSYALHDLSLMQLKSETSTPDGIQLFKCRFNFNNGGLSLYVNHGASGEFPTRRNPPDVVKANECYLTCSLAARAPLPRVARNLLRQDDGLALARSCKKLVGDRILRRESPNRLLPVLELIYTSSAANTSFSDAISQAIRDYAPNDASPQLVETLSAATPFDGVSAKHSFQGPTELPAAKRWLLGEGDWCFQFEFDKTETLLSIERFVDQLAGTKGVFQEVLDGIKRDINGPRIDMIDEFVEHLGNELHVICNVNRGNREYPSDGWLTAISVANSDALQATIEKLMAADPQASKFRAFQSGGGDIKIISNFLFVGDPQMIQRAELRQLKTSAPPIH